MHGRFDFQMLQQVLDGIEEEEDVQDLNNEWIIYIVSFENTKPNKTWRQAFKLAEFSDQISFQAIASHWCS